MASLIQSYEQQYSVLTADITSKIGLLKVGADDNKEDLSKDIETQFEEANDLLEQLELEARGSGASSRVPAYRAELQRVRLEFTSVVNGDSGYDNEDFEDWSGGNEQKRKLLSISDPHSSDRGLKDDYRVAMETGGGDAGDNTRLELNAQTDSLNKTRGRLRDTETQPPPGWSTRIYNTVLVKSLQDKYVIVMAFMILGVFMCAGLYFYVT